MIHYLQHIPCFVEGTEPKSAEFEKLEELLSAESEWLENGCIFATDEKCECLMISSKKEKWWWVLGEVEGVDLAKHLPIYDKVYQGEE